MKRWFRSDQTLVGEGLRFIKPKVVQGVVGPVRRTSFQLVRCVSHGVPKPLDERQRLERDWSEDEQLAWKIGRLRFIKPNVVGCVRGVAEGSDKPGGLSPRDRSNAIDGLGKARTIKPNELQAAGERGFG